MTRYKAPYLFFAALALLLPGGCASLQSNEPPPAIYVLHPRFTDNVSPSAPVTGSTIIEVPVPEVPAGFDSDRIALYWDQGRRLDYYAAAQWPSPLDRLLGDFIIRSGQQSLPGTTFVSPDLGLSARYRLAVKVTEFQPVYKGAPTGEPALYESVRFSLISLPDEKVAADFVVAEYGKSSSDDLTAITTGLESLLQSILAKGFSRIAPVVKPLSVPGE